MGAGTQSISQKPHLQKLSRSHTCKNFGAPKQNGEERDRQGRGQIRQKIQKACSYWLAGICKHAGDDCRYLHSHSVGGSDVTFLTKLVGHRNKVGSFLVSLFALHILSLFWSLPVLCWFSALFLVFLIFLTYPFDLLSSRSWFLYFYVFCFLVRLSSLHVHLPAAYSRDCSSLSFRCCFQTLFCWTRQQAYGLGLPYRPGTLSFYLHSTLLSSINIFIEAYHLLSQTGYRCSFTWRQRSWMPP